jgi:hypothetical protein
MTRGGTDAAERATAIAPASQNLIALRVITRLIHL